MCVWLAIRLISCQIRNLPGFARHSIRADVFSWIHRKATSLSAVTSLPIPDSSACYLALRFLRVLISKQIQPNQCCFSAILKHISWHLSISLTVVSRYACSFVILFSLDFPVNQSASARWAVCVCVCGLVGMEFIIPTGVELLSIWKATWLPVTMLGINCNILGWDLGEQRSDYMQSYWSRPHADGGHPLLGVHAGVEVGERRTTQM